MVNMEGLTEFIYLNFFIHQNCFVILAVSQSLLRYGNMQGHLVKE